MALARTSLQRRRHDLLRLGDNLVEVRRALEALGVNLVDVFGAGRAHGEPAVCNADFQAANVRVVAGSARQPGETRCRQ